MTQTGGAGGNPVNGATGGNGAASVLTDAVSGRTDGGALVLSQTAVGGAGGGAGGGTVIAGIAGAASSSLTFDDTKNTTQSATVEADTIATGGAGGSGDPPRGGGVGGRATALTRLTGAGPVTANATATGGVGGNQFVATGTAPPSGPGGHAQATAFAESNDTTGGPAIANATATGGAGGFSNSPGTGEVVNGGNGGGVTNTSATASGTSAVATSTATGGAGNFAVGIGATGGRPGFASGTSATATAGTGDAIATVVQTGGAGGSAGDGADAAAGANSVLSQAVSGSTHSGQLTLSQTAIGGRGGSSVGTGEAGVGGRAYSNLVFDDTSSVSNSQTVIASSAAIGGAGGTGGIAAGGAATAGIQLYGFNAIAASSSATAGLGSGGAAVALATPRGYGHTGTVGSHASTGLATGGHVTSVVADASTGFAGGSVAAATTAQAEIGGTAHDLIDTGEGVAFVTGAPASASTDPVLTQNPTIAAAAGASPIFLAQVELGGSYAVGGSGVETETSSFAITVKLDAADLTKDLVIGLFGGTNHGSVTDVSLDIFANNVDTFKDIGDGAAATAYFTDHAINLGSLSAGGTLNLDITLKVTSDTAVSGFYGGIVVTG